MLPRMASISDYHLAEIELFLIEELGNISACAKRMQVTRSALADKIARTPELQRAKGDLVQSVLDKAEKNIFSDVEAGDQTASKFVLQTIGKDRGYTTKSEVDANIMSGEEAANKLLAARQRAQGIQPSDAAVTEGAGVAGSVASPATPLIQGGESESE